MSYPPDPNNPYGQPQQPNPYGQQPPQQPGYGYPQQQQPPQPGYGYPQQPPADPYAQPPGYDQQAGYQQPAPPYGYQQDPYAGYVQNMYAGWGSRVVARLIDGLVVSLIPTLIVFFALQPSTSVSVNPTTGAVTSSTSGSMGLYYFAQLVVFLLASAVLAWMKSSWGQSLGQKAVNIRMVREADGQRLSFGMAFVREIAHLLDNIVCCVGYLWPLWDAKKQTFADKIMTTVVTKAS